MPHIFARYEGQLLSAIMPWQYALGFVERWCMPLKARLTFQEGAPVCWKLRSRITLRPDTRFGQPCIEQSRIPTSAIWSYVKRGDSIEYVARCFRLALGGIGIHRRHPHKNGRHDHEDDGFRGLNDTGDSLNDGSPVSQHLLGPLSTRRVPPGTPSGAP